MTVCVAAIAGGGTCVYGASDRMITSYDIEFEPQLELSGVEKGTSDEGRKIVPLTSSIVVMIAGNDIATLTQLIYELRDRVLKRVKDEPGNWWKVADVAYLYQNIWREYRHQAIERKVLSPLGLTFETLTSRQQELSNQVINEIVSRIDGFRLPNLSVIFAGADPTGAHLYVAINGEVSCQDLVGFAAIGSGNFHAESQFMQLGHNKNSTIPRAAYLTYVAK